MILLLLEHRIFYQLNYQNTSGSYHLLNKSNQLAGSDFSFFYCLLKKQWFFGLQNWTELLGVLRCTDI